MRRAPWIGAAALVAIATAVAPGRAAAPAAPPVTFQFDRFEPKGLGISVLKPTGLALATRPDAHGFKVFQGTEPQTRTQVTLFVVTAARSPEALAASLPALTGIPAKRWMAVESAGPTRGFAWQRGHVAVPRPGITTAALLLRHGQRDLSYVLVVETLLANTVRYSGFYQQAYTGLRALPR
jgi:hypothetical protein